MVDTPNNTLERLIRLPEVKSRTGLSSSDLYRRVDAGTFPRQIKLGVKAVAWIETEVQEWIEQTIQSAREGVQQ
ncbi:MAG: AlpA family transcriptional regulator [Clostridiales bacterium]|nr:AlpA family transcriptional regulator [Clostridiales bacterium]